LHWQLTELSGNCVQPGYGVGRVTVPGSVVSAGDILVAAAIEPADVPTMLDCSALVMESGDLASHAAITARELGIPALVGVSNALGVLRPGELAYVDAERQHILRSVPDDGICQLCEGPARIEILQSNSFRAVEDMFPVVKSHLLIVPKRHIIDIAGLDRDEWADFGSLLIRMRDYLAEKLGATAFNLAMNMGDVAGQTIEHLHWHVLPRTPGDDEDPRGGVRKIISHPYRPYPPAG
jgi:ATP adenylyltransferase